MTPTKLEQVIREYIMDIYKKQYTGKIKIKELNPGYCIYLDIGHQYHPLVIYAELNDVDFLKFLKEDLKTRNFHFSHYAELNLVYPDTCKPLKSCCNDKR